LFIVITPEWYLFTGFISTAVVGTIILVFLGRKEEREKISVKWRFYTLLSLFILLILFGVLFFIQLSTIPV
jgi:drug/metabolite transporter (DMT)-like permease